MMSSKMTVVSAPSVDDPDVFIRMCNSHRQQQRRQKLVQKSRWKRLAITVLKNLLVAAVGGAVTVSILAMIF